MSFLLFVGGVVWGICAFFAFTVLALLSVEHMCRVVWGDTHGCDELYLVEKLFVELGVMRTLPYVVIALLWPLLVISVLVMNIAHKQYRSFEELPTRTQQKLEWFLLGFGKFSPRTVSS